MLFSNRHDKQVFGYTASLGNKNPGQTLICPGRISQKNIRGTTRFGLCPLIHIPSYMPPFYDCGFRRPILRPSSVPKRPLKSIQLYRPYCHPTAGSSLFVRIEGLLSSSSLQNTVCPLCFHLTVTAYLLFIIGLPCLIVALRIAPFFRLVKQEFLKQSGANSVSVRVRPLPSAIYKHFLRHCQLFYDSF